MDQFAFTLGQNVRIKGILLQSIVIGRAVWETLSVPTPTNYYEVRGIDGKSFMVAEAELEASE